MAPPTITTRATDNGTPPLSATNGFVTLATITTALFKRGLRNQMIQDVVPLDASKPTMVGEAFTLRYIPAREDLNTIDVFRNRAHPQRKAVEDCPAGAVLVMDSRKDARAASAGAILVTPDMGQAKSAARFANVLGLPIAAGNKERVSDSEVKINALIGNQVHGNRCALIYDDEIATGGSIHELSRVLIDQGDSLIGG